MVKKLAITAACTIIFIFQGRAQQANPDLSKYIQWNELYALKWTDFKGKPGEDAIGDAGTAVAIKAKPYMIHRKIHYDVYALFNKDASWYRDQSPALLAHEQLHFDIAELYARKTRKKIMEMAQAGVKDLHTYNSAIQKILNESNRIDQQYDLETLHGAITNKQQEWKQKIKSELLALKAYKVQTIDL